MMKDRLVYFGITRISQKLNMYLLHAAKFLDVQLIQPDYF